jgi:CheY-like chemotaxis protein
MPTTVLIADDSAVARRVLARALADAGFAVVEAGSVAEAAAVDADALDAAVLDLELEDGDGVAIAEALRRARPDLPLAFFSAGASRALRDRATTLGPVYAKPDEADRVIAWATHFLR